MAQKNFIIRGTGFENLDGTLVTVAEVKGDGWTAVVPHGKLKSLPILVDSRCIQDVDLKETYDYKFEISKSDGSSVTYFIDNALRNVSLETVVEFLNSHLKPILKMEQ